MKRTAALTLSALLAVACATVQAKLPAPSDEAKAKAAETAAKAAHGGKVANFQLCKSMDQTAAGYFAAAKKTGKAASAAVATPACADPGAFVYVADGTAPAAAASPAATVAAAALKPAAKK